MIGAIRLAAAAAALVLAPAARADHRTTLVCGGTVSFANTCSGEALFIRICLGEDGAAGRTSLQVRAGGRPGAVSVPLRSTATQACGVAPTDECPGETEPNVDRCETEFDDAVFLDVIQTMLAETRNVHRYKPEMQRMAQCLFDALQGLTPGKKGDLLDAAIKPAGAERSAAVDAWYRTVYDANPAMAIVAGAC